MATLAPASAGPTASVADGVRQPMRQPGRLRIGLFMASCRQPRVLVDALEEIAGSAFAEIVMIAANERPAASPPWLWRAYYRCDAGLCGDHAPAGESIDLRSRLSCGYMSRLPEGRLEAAVWRPAVVRRRLDVALVIGDIDDELFTGLAGYGVWRLDCGGRPGFEGMREVLEGRAISSVSLKIRGPAGQEEVLDQSWTRTHRFSLAGNRERLLHRAGQLLGRALERLHRRAGAPLAAARPAAHRRSLPRPAASNLDALLGLGGVSLQILRRAMEKVRTVDQWLLAWRFADGEAEPAAGPFFCLVPPTDRFWADPFPLERDGRHFVFFEELPFATGKAHIAMLEIGRDGRCSPPRRVLERPYHLSYPCLIEDGGELFMVPESGMNGSVELYRCTAFPDRWELEKVLLRLPCCADATVHREDGRWWMFVNIGRDGHDVHDELFLYSADRLDGEWLPHPANPLKSDVRSARPAGRLYRQGGELYRPAQIGVPHYGAGISLNRVLRLTPGEYREVEAGRILPFPGSEFLGIHTINRAGDLTVVDGFIRRRRWGGKVADRFTPIVERLAETSDAIS